jgi:hypothetical protein
LLVIGNNLSFSQQFNSAVIDVASDVCLARPLSELILALEDEVLEQRSAKGEAEAQFSLGYLLVSEADRDAGFSGPGTHLGAGGKSLKADAGLALPPNYLKSLSGPRRVDVIT